MIYDCFVFNDEYDLLEIRFNILKEFVDRFVVVEGNRDFKGKEKELRFPGFRKKLEAWDDKIIYVVVDDFPEYESTWQYEYWQRNGIGLGLKGLNEDDIVIISDVDEIPNPELLKDEYIENLESSMVLAQLFSNFYLNYIDVTEHAWYGSVILPFKDFLSAQESRNLAIKLRNNFEANNVIQNGGWHFSFLGGIEAIRHKLRTYTHQEYNIKEYEDDEVLLNSIKKGESIFHKKDYKFKVVPMDDRFPDYIMNNLSKFKHLILEAK